MARSSLLRMINGGGGGVDGPTLRVRRSECLAQFSWEANLCRRHLRRRLVFAVPLEVAPIFDD
jgi:hypothetical protein